MFATPKKEILPIETPTASNQSGSTTVATAEPHTAVVPPVQPRIDMTQKNKQPSQEAVLSRARRIARQELKTMWEAAGLTGEPSKDALVAHLKNATEVKAKAGEDGDKENHRITALEDELKKASSQVATLNGELAKTKKDLTVAQKRSDVMEIEFKVREAAYKEGVTDSDYAIHLFRQHVKKLPEGEAPDANKFFGGLKSEKTMKFLFQPNEVLAGPQSLDQKQTPKGNDVAVTTPQQPAPADGKPAEPPDVEKMSHRDFVAHAQSKYGVSLPRHG